MCVAILKTPAGRLTDAVLKACFENNNHGAGFAFVNEEGRMTTMKGYFEFDKFLEAYRPVEERVAHLGPMLVHFRISTGGTKSTENCHPFLFKHGALVHNGHFFSATSEKSDTNMLVSEIGDYLTKKNVAGHRAEIEEAFGKNNKVAILYKDRTYELINEQEGSWIESNWFSNDFWRHRLPSSVIPFGRRVDGLRFPQRTMGPVSARDAWRGNSEDIRDFADSRALQRHPDMHTD